MASARDRSTAAQLLIEKAVRAWRYKYPRSKIDDCAVVCLFFKRPRPVLTKSASEITQLSVNYPELDSRSYAGSMNSVDALDTVLNYKVNGSPESAETKGDQLDSRVNRPRKRRPGRKLECVGE